MVHVVVLAVLIATVASFTRLVVDDEITYRLREKIRGWSGEYGFFTRLLKCSRCVAVWVAPAPTSLVLAAYTHLGLMSWWMSLIALPFAVMGVAYLSFRFLESE
jgi:hypothetical protein